MRPTVYGTRHAISAGHYLAAAAGFSILEAGGNAVDAGVAAGLALGVLQPDLVSIGGVAPILIRRADGAVESIAGLGRWPRRLPPDLFLREHGGRIPEGVLRTVTPAAVDAWITALARHGTMRFADVVAPAIRFAADGFAVYPLLARSIAAHADEYRRWPQNAAVFLPGNRVPEVGAKFAQPDLARTLQFLADQDRAAPDRQSGLAAARDAFYLGDIAREIAAFQKREGGYLSLDDLATYHSPIEPVVRRYWRGHEVIVCGPWCQGPALLEALLLIEHVGITGLKHNSPEYLHRVIECLNLALADREHLFGDPDFVDVPIERLLDPATIARRAAAVRSERAMGAMPPPLEHAEAPPEPSRTAMPKVEAPHRRMALPACPWYRAWG
jgi:gamma-glutamyltranspeptidase/glutathione hydrolase